MSLRAAVLLAPCMLLACARTDVGRPCNHGPGFVPDDQAITFPALACDHLLCVYAEDLEPSEEPCVTSSDCNPPGTEEKLVCEEGRCVADPTYVLSRSMCSERCEVDDDCQGGDPDTTCSRGFACARIQGLGDHCCEKLCVCKDDLDVAAAADLERTCTADTTPGCCDQDPHPEFCGV